MISVDVILTLSIFWGYIWFVSSYVLIHSGSYSSYPASESGAKKRGLYTRFGVTDSGILRQEMDEHMIELELEYTCLKAWASP